MTDRRVEKRAIYKPQVEEIQRELSKAESIDDFFGKEGIFARLFARTLEGMLEAELSAQLGDEKYEAKGRNSGNSRNGKRTKQVQSSTGEQRIAVLRDRKGEFASPLLEGRRSNELEEKVISLYAKGSSTRDIQTTLAELYGVEVTAPTISAITDKVWPLVEQWQNRPLAEIYAIVYLDAFYVKLRREGKVENIAVYDVLGVNLDGHKEVLGHWVGTGAEGANFWLSVLTDLQNRGVSDIFIACVDGLKGFSEAIEALFPATQVQRGVIHQIRHRLSYVTWRDQKAFMKDLRTVYQAVTREEAETNLLHLGEKWGSKYPAAIRSWEQNWAELSIYFDFPAEIRRLIYTTTTVEGYHRQVRNGLKNKGSLPGRPLGPEAVRKLLFLANREITKKWTMPVANWAKIRNQLAIRFEERFPL